MRDLVFGEKLPVFMDLDALHDSCVRYLKLK